MASVPILNTGANTAVFLDNSQVNRSAEKLTSDVLGAEKMKLGKALEDNEKFLQMMAVDPVALMTQRGVEQQSEVMTEFNDKWAGEMKKYKGILPQEKWIEMRKDRIGVESIQGRLGASQQRYLEELKQFTANPRKYNEESFLTAAKNFYDTGNYETGLIAAPIDVSATWQKAVNQYRRNIDPNYLGTKGGKDEYTRGDKAEVEKLALDFALNTDGALEGIVNMFINEAPPEVFKQVDKDQSGDLSNDEIALYRGMPNDYVEIASNPIMKWWTQSRGADYQDKFSKKEAKKSDFNFGGGMMSVNLLGQKIDLVPPASQGAYDLGGGVESSEFYPFNLKESFQLNLPKDAIAISERKNRIKGDVSAYPGKYYIVGYDAENGYVRLKPTTQMDVSNIRVGSILAPISSLPVLQGLPVNKGGTITTIGQGQTAAPRKKVLNLETGKWE